MRGSRWVAGGCAVLFAFVWLTGSVVGQVDEAAAGDAVSRARGDLSFVYAAVLDAETAGADVSDYLPRLNAAGASLTQAERCLREGNFSGAVHFAGLVSAGLVGLAGDAAELGGAAGVKRGQALVWTVAGSVFGVIVVAVAGFVSWGRVRAWHIRRALTAKPEVAEAAAS